MEYVGEIPIYPSLLRRHDLTRTHVILYGVIVALHRNGTRPTHAVMRYLSDIRDERGLRRMLLHLEERGLIRRINRPNRALVAIEPLLELTG